MLISKYWYMLHLILKCIANSVSRARVSSPSFILRKYSGPLQTQNSWALWTGHVVWYGLIYLSYFTHKKTYHHIQDYFTIKLCLFPIILYLILYHAKKTFSGLCWWEVICSHCVYLILTYIASIDPWPPTWLCPLNREAALQWVWCSTHNRKVVQCSYLKRQAALSCN